MLKNLFLAFLILFSPFSVNAYTATDYTVIENQAKTPVLTPSLAAQKTAKIRLKNGLEALIISDPNTDKSGAVLTMRTGSWEDPENYPGIAHFLEHMLFLGTKKYPNESEYDRYITEHGGLTNAFTTNDYTAYLFSVNNSAFQEALDRFSNFYKEPLFNPSGVARELQAIDQEFAKNIENDDFREVAVAKELANPSHPFHRFSIGNSSTLTKVSQETLKAWYRSHYSANLMRLVVLSPLPLDELISLVVEDFKDVPTLNRSDIDIDKPIFSPEYDGKIVYIEPIKNIRTLDIVWDLPAKFSSMLDTKPETIVCYVLGHEGVKSLLANLKKEKFATELRCGSFELGPKNTQLFLDITLTDSGVKHVDEVIKRVFQAIANFKQKGVPPYLFDEVQGIGKVRYQYQSREDVFLNLMKQAMWLPRENMSTYPEHTQIIQKFDPQATADLINYLTPQNAHYYLVAPSNLTQVPPDRKEKWVDVPYAIRPIPQTTYNSWIEAKPNPDIDLPTPNPYIPAQLALVMASPLAQKEHPIVPQPTKILDREQGRFYFAADTQFLAPKIGWIFEVKSPQIDMRDPLKIALADLYVKCLNDALTPTSYPATQAELNYEIKRADNGISIEIEGYSDKAPMLLTEILNQMKTYEPTQERYKVFKESLLRDYQNSAFESPLQQASEAVKSVVYKNFPTDKQKGAALRKATFEKFAEYTQGLFQQVYIQGVLFGNQTEDQAKEIAELTLRHFDGTPYLLDTQLRTEVIVLPAEKGPFYVDTKIDVQGNAAVLVVQTPEFSQKNRAAQQILMQAISEPFFAELRTRQQTGYIVYSSGEEIERRLFDFFAVQSNTHDPRDLLARFELFIERYLQEMHLDLPLERFEKIRTAIATNLKTPAKNIKDMAELLNLLAFKYDGNFHWMDERLAAVNALTYEEFLTFAQKSLGRHNKRRFSLLLRGILPESNIFQYQHLPGIQTLRKVSAFEPRNVLNAETQRR